MSTTGLCLWKEKDIGRLLAKALEGKVKLRLPMVQAELTNCRLIRSSPVTSTKEFDTLVIDEAPDRPRLVASTGSEGAASSNFSALGAEDWSVRRVALLPTPATDVSLWRGGRYRRVVSRRP